jgi:poly-gamma-glutamate synthesis protein (capsule biosynthesis protein)
MAQYGESYPYELIRHLLTGDIVFGNLEGALTNGGEPWPKGFTFRTPPQYAPGLASAGFDIVALANNHTMDFGAVGMLDTISALNEAGVHSAGAGLNDASAWAPAVLQANGLTVAFIACALTPDEGGGFSIYAWAAGATTAGMAVCSTDRITTDVRAARAINDFVVVSVHAGDEYVNAPNTTQVVLSEAALAAGADVVLGHHAHVVQPVEQRGGQLIAWGLSNFIFDLDQWDLAGIPAPRVSPILHVTLTQGAGVTSWRADAVLLDADTDRPRPATADEAAVLDALLVP